MIVRKQNMNLPRTSKAGQAYSLGSLATNTDFRSTPNGHQSELLGHRQAMTSQRLLIAMVPSSKNYTVFCMVPPASPPLLMQLEVSLVIG